jgi:hypothetical protein
LFDTCVLYVSHFIIALELQTLCIQLDVFAQMHLSWAPIGIQMAKAAVKNVKATAKGFQVACSVAGINIVDQSPFTTFTVYLQPM